jgi:hypothetical protein
MPGTFVTGMPGEEAVAKLDQLWDASAAVVADLTNIDAVASDIANVNTVAGDIANVNTVAGIAANVTTVAGISANVTTVAGDHTAINTVAGDHTPLNTVAGDHTALNTVAGISANVTTVAGISICCQRCRGGHVQHQLRRGRPHEYQYGGYACQRGRHLRDEHTVAGGCSELRRRRCGFGRSSSAGIFGHARPDRRR